MQKALTTMRQAVVWLRQFFSVPRHVFWFGMVIALAATAIETFRGRNTNYFDYFDSTMMFWQGISSYTMEYAEAHDIYFLYSPVFSVVYTPIFLLPWWLGPFVWNVMNYTLMYLSVWTLPERLHPYRNKIFLFLLSVLLQSIFCFQYNTVLCYIFLFAFTLLERNKPLWAVLLIMFGACTKVYPLAGLAMLLFYPRMWRNFAWAALCGVLLLLIPAVNPNVEHFWTLYEGMFSMIASHHGDSEYIGILFAKGLKWLLLPNMRLVQIGTIGLLGALCFWRKPRWDSFFFRCCVLATLMGYVILFSDCPETHTHLISLAGYQLAFWLNPRRRWYDWALFWLLLVNFGVFPTDVLCPNSVYHFFHNGFWLDVYCMFFAWLRTIWLAVGPWKADPDMTADTDVTE